MKEGVAIAHKKKKVEGEDEGEVRLREGTAICFAQTRCIMDATEAWKWNSEGETKKD